MDRRADIREQALKDLQQSEVLMTDGHFDYGNGYYGRLYVNPPQLCRHPSTIWRFAQDLIDLIPSEIVQRTEGVAGPVTRGALLAVYDCGTPRQPPQPDASTLLVRPVQLRSGRRIRPAHRQDPLGSGAARRPPRMLQIIIGSAPAKVQPLCNPLNAFRHRTASSSIRRIGTARTVGSESDMRSRSNRRTSRRRPRSDMVHSVSP